MIDIRHLTKRFESRGAKPVVDDISMTVEEGELCVLLGPSGCGKTTTLKMINRLVQPTSGQILIGGADTASFNVVELRRRIGYAIQQVGLFPNMTVAQNIGVVPQLLGWDKARIHERTRTLLRMVSLDPDTFMPCYPRDLSGGQQQRVGVARALAADPPVMLMDEPFGAIDPINRASIQDEFRHIQKSLKKTVMFVSHDIDEAMKMGDKVAIFRDGKIEQMASPDELLARPASAFVAEFVGADRALKRLRLMRAADAALESSRVARLGYSTADARALLRDHIATSLIVLDAQGKPVGHVGAVEVAAAGATLEAAQVRALPGVVHASDDLRSVISMLLAQGATWLPAIDADGRFIGYVTHERIALMARAACVSGEASPHAIDAMPDAAEPALATGAVR
ncbi:ABC transporter ATP-binding protein [Paraburkholderia youngii]|uniref:Quaternary amine transport ATP-binding protein n=1 Tax=Paraburkholderia youngii TaxID=2782701 RepID=A0A7W8P2P9_9BURK|nr:ABC transporter ATP-binding protein [Paraburkholderia youngii]MBB5398057.1 osmoprotectant transport system ATP-binding protein [Paraburkholderia youngii]